MSSTPGSFSADLLTAAPASFIPSEITGDVAICLSGGGSRAFSAGLGQLQALEILQANGKSLLSQVALMTTVSGGGWIGIPFVYLPSTFTDAGFLGAYVPPANLTYDLIDTSPSGIGATINSGFSIPEIAVMALYLCTQEGVPWDMAWQTIMGVTFLQPFGLFIPGSDDAPTSLFSYDAATLSQYVTGPNHQLSTVAASLVAQPDAQRRPYLVSLCGLSVAVGATPALIAPVQCTPILTGVLSTPPGAVDVNQRSVGGGGIPSFAFNSLPTAATATTATIQQSRQWSLTDILGTSSAAYAETLIQYFAVWKINPAQFQADLAAHRATVLGKLLRANMVTAKSSFLTSSVGLATPDMLAALPSAVEDLNPHYDYWSPANPPVNLPANTNQFTDGGSLENSGIATALAYSNITKIIAFINSEQPLTQNADGSIYVDDSIPPLFGYQPCSGGTYTPYGPGQTVPTKFLPFQFNQVFASAGTNGPDTDDFTALQQGLWQASGSGQNSGAAIFTQQLTTQPNNWFGVPGNQPVTVVWVYLNYNKVWHESIPDFWVRAAIDLEIDTASFPNYNTFNTGLSAIQVNLLSNFTSWTLQSNAAALTALFS